MSDKVLTSPPHTAPTAFTRAQLDWLPWLEPLAVEAMTERHLASLVDAARVKSPYFRLLARDPDALEARTLTDKDIFYNPDAGLPRAERELAATATSRFSTAASTAPPCTRGTPRPTRSARPTWSACSMTGSPPTSASDGTPSSRRRWP